MARPRNAEADGALLSAASDTLRERGYDGLIVDDLAKRVGVAKTTVYRRWPTKNHLVVDVIALWQGAVRVPDTGEIRGDLVELVVGMCRTLDSPPMRRIAGELVGASVRDAGFRQLLDKVWSERRAAVAVVLGRAIEEGRLGSGVHVKILMDQLAGAVYYRALVSGDPLDDDYAAALVDAVLGEAR